MIEKLVCFLQLGINLYKSKYLRKEEWNLNVNSPAFNPISIMYSMSLINQSNFVISALFHLGFVFPPLG